MEWIAENWVFVLFVVLAYIAGLITDKLVNGPRIEENNFGVKVVQKKGDDSIQQIVFYMTPEAEEEDKMLCDHIMRLQEKEKQEKEKQKKERKEEEINEDKIDEQIWEAAEKNE